MVKVAIAGGSGNVASEIINGILAKEKNEVIVLTRQNVTDQAIKGVHVVLSFLVVHIDSGNVIQKNLIEACVKAGVKRFAPSEWGVKNNSGIPPYKNKDEVAKYFAEINRDKKDLIKLGEEIRGAPFEIDRVKAEDIEKGELKTSWVPPMTHPTIPLEQREAFSKEFVIMFMLGILRGAWDVSDEWNRLLPEYKFTSAEDYLR